MAEPEIFKATVQIFGDTYKLRGPASPEHMERLAAIVDQRMQEIGQKSKNVSVAKIAVMAAFHLADDLLKLQEDYDDLVKLLDDTSGAK
ncbi:cell division protein ZapA [Heliophilum fasciatum]|uniref:Cell division protein ZapA n=1 Tax=Heliophilum fasciatum TaxID=35700 RepID=A0A4R2RZ93_9FIRM|nr:cell division protein ZapA [Heliophilum fasciatum]MCW2276765.1 cell division protein ZapA [Heliophilum fasciatum]TCP68854.1 cell division protein ZapA [Heliophilum fasciatum]